jgi:flagellar hook-length control protein FliK
MTADVGTTRQALEQSLPSLASSLRDAGFTLAGGGVFQQWGQGQRDGSGAGPSSRLPGTADDAADDAVSMTVSATPLRRAAGLVDVFA